MPSSAPFRLAALAGALGVAVGAVAAPALRYHLLRPTLNGDMVGVDNRGRVGVSDYVQTGSTVVSIERGTSGELEELDTRGFDLGGVNVMNGRGDLAGYKVMQGRTVGVVWPHDTWTYFTVDTPQGSTSWPQALGDFGRIGGELDNDCAVWDASGHLGRRGRPKSSGYCGVGAVGQSGDVYVNATFYHRAYQWRVYHWGSNGVFTSLPDLPGSTGLGSRLYAGNRDGLMVGMSNQHAVTWKDGVITDLGDGTAYGVNDLGDVVGTSGARATLYSGGEIVDLASRVDNLEPNWVLVDAHGINDDGAISGTAIFDGLYRPYLLIPVAP